MSEIDKGEQIKEVYARFGLALYHAQVLEHGIVNALVILDLISTQRHLAKSQGEWSGLVDEFMDLQFQKPLGRLIAALRSVSTVPSHLEALLREALESRNWLAHHFFRERAAEFLNSGGRDGMLAEVDRCRARFEAADSRLSEITGPLRKSAGLTDEMISAAISELKGNESDG